ncbi:MAG: MATE family efflux transporter [Lachnospiraceae bacterium]|nr:MATE family efflux transporter [Lachnospiraceae bacterium]
MNIQLSEHFSYRKLLRFTLPSIVMMVFTSIYGVVDGFFVSNYAGKTQFAAVNLIMPFLMILGTIGFMFGTGGSALVSKTMGEGRKEKAQQIFSQLIYASMILGVLFSAAGIAFLRPVSAALGAEGQMLDDCVLYGRIILAALTAFILQNEFQSFFVAAERPQLGLLVTVIAGVANMALDALFVAVFRWGIAGAALATAASQVLGGVIPLIYFLRPNPSALRLVKSRFEGRVLLRACVNGSSEMMSNLSMSLVSMLYNAQLMKFAGENGVAAYGVLMYVTFVFLAIFIGISIGSAPIVSYHYGAENHGELKSLRRKSTVVILAFSAVMFVLAQVLAAPLAEIFVGYDAKLSALTCRAFHFYAFTFLLAGVNIYGSAFFTALNNGLISALISFLRTLVFQVAAVLIFPIFWEIDGVWLSAVAAELLSALVTIAFLAAKKKHYHY